MEYLVGISLALLFCAAAAALDMDHFNPCEARAPCDQWRRSTQPLRGWSSPQHAEGRIWPLEEMPPS